MKRILLPAFLSLIGTLSSLYLSAQPKIQLVNFASGFNLPLDIEHCGDSRLFVVERPGLIWVLDSLGNRLDTFLNIDPRVNSTQNEQGLLGLAFDPHYAENGYFYVDYTKNGAGDTRVARFSVKPNNPNEADPNSELTILEQAQPFWNHNGGCLRFGPDGYLYISLGDGGSGGDPQGNGQNKKTFLGKILRIDVRNSSAAQPYAVPSDNPFVGNTDYFPEIWSYGWRNPWRYSFDRLTGDMWVADVGQNLWEEVDFEPAHTPGLNYGWRCYEGTHTYNTNGCQPADNYVSPFFDYAHSGANGCSVTGGFIYRGSKYPDLYGCYLFADYCSGRWWYTKRNADGTFTTNILANLGGYEFSSFGEGPDGELYVALLSSGKIQKVKELCSPFQLVLNQIQPACANTPGGLIDVTTVGGTGNITYNWSSGSGIYLYPGTYSLTVTDANGCSRVGNYEVGLVGPNKPELTANDTLLCANSSVILTASNLAVPSTLTWYNGSTIVAATQTSSPTATLSVTQPGDYSVSIGDSLCQPISEIVRVVRVGPDNPTLIASDSVLCPNGSIILTAGNLPVPSTLHWYNGTELVGTTTSSTPISILNVTQPGNYTVTIVDPNCTPTSSQVALVNETPVEPKIASVYDSLYALTPCTGCQWLYQGQAITGATSAYHIATEEGYYSLQITTPHGCQYISNEVYFLKASSKLPASVIQFSLSPNPTERNILLELKLAKLEHVNISLADTNQRQVFAKKVDSQTIALPIDLSNLPVGTYFLTVQTEGGSIVRKVVKK